MVADGNDEVDRIIGRLIREVKPMPEYVQIWQFRSDDRAYFILKVDFR